MNDLDQLLHDWGRRNEPTTAQVDDLQARVMKGLKSSASASNLPLKPSAIAHPVLRFSTTRGMLEVIVAFAASLIVAFWISQLSEFGGNTISSEATDVVAANSVDQQSLFAELDRMFDGRWRWLSEINGRVHLQTDELNDTSTEPGLSVRLTVIRRRPGQAGWTVVWEASVLSHTDEWVQLPKDLMAGATISVWSHELPDGSVLVESDVALTKPVALQLAEPHIYGPMPQSARLWSAQRADGDFQLIQSISRLESGHG